MSHLAHMQVLLLLGGGEGEGLTVLDIVTAGVVNATKHFSLAINTPRFSLKYFDGNWIENVTGSWPIGVFLKFWPVRHFYFHSASVSLQWESNKQSQWTLRASSQRNVGEGEGHLRG